MNTLTQIIGWLYTQSLILYPYNFRAEFHDEMEDIFTQATAERASEGNGKVLAFFLRELKDFPGSLLRQHRVAIKKENIPMTAISETNQIQEQTPAIKRHPGSWGAAFMAGVPYLLFGLLISMGKLININVYQFSPSLNAIIGIFLAILVICALIYSWRHDWPVWSASWYLFGTWIILVILGLGIGSLDLEISWIINIVLLGGWILLCIVGYFALLLKSNLHAILSIAFLFPMLGIMMLEFIPNPIEGWLGISLGLLTALTAGAIIRIGDFRIGLGLVLGVNLVAGLAWAYISEYKMLDLPAGIPAHVPRISTFFLLFALYIILALGIIALPFIVRGLWHFGKRLAK